jgi:hypothetical protein
MPDGLMMHTLQQRLVSRPMPDIPAAVRQQIRTDR